MPKILNALLTHQPPAAVAAMLEWWRGYTELDRILVVAGGAAGQCAGIAHPHRISVADPRLRTQDHQRERQSYAGVYRAIAEWLQGRDFTHVFFAEFDHLPVEPAFEQRFLERLEREAADILGHQVVRVDGTNHPHYLHHRAEPRFHAYWRSVSRRAEPEVVLSMFGSGSFWSRAALEAVARCTEPFPIYLELYLPTLAHHLGYRVRGLPDQDPWVQVIRDLGGEIDAARAAGAWTVHPVKHRWTAPPPG